MGFGLSRKCRERKTQSGVRTPAEVVQRNFCRGFFVRFSGGIVSKEEEKRLPTGQSVRKGSREKEIQFEPMSGMRIQRAGFLSSVFIL